MGLQSSLPSPLFPARSMTLLPFLRPQPLLQRFHSITLYRSIRMSSSIATLVADARKTLPPASKDSAAVDAWVEKISSGEEGKDLQVRLLPLLQSGGKQLAKLTPRWTCSM